MSDDVYFHELHTHHLYDGMEEDFCPGEEVIILGPTGPVEVLTSATEGYDGSKPIAILCHPHSLHGGSMNNKVVHMLADTLSDMGLLSVSFNFRGVGKSKGSFDHGVGETDDMLAVVEWFRRRYHQAPIWLVGFSFGAYVALRGHTQAEADRLLLVAPPVGMFDFDGIPDVEIPWMVIQGGKDEIIEPGKVSNWVQGQKQHPEYHWMAEADHFFHGRLNRLRETVTESWG